jgi:hypothetical protein
MRSGAGKKPRIARAGRSIHPTSPVPASPVARLSWSTRQVHHARGDAAAVAVTRRRRRPPAQAQRLVLRPITATGNNKTMPGTVLLRNTTEGPSVSISSSIRHHFRPTGALNGRPVSPGTGSERPTHRDGAWLQDLFYLLLMILRISTYARMWRTRSHPHIVLAANCPTRWLSYRRDAAPAVPTASLATRVGRLSRGPDLARPGLARQSGTIPPASTPDGSPAIWRVAIRAGAICPGNPGADGLYAGGSALFRPGRS